MFSMIGPRALPAIFVAMGVMLILTGFSNHRRVELGYEQAVTEMVDARIMQNLNEEYGNTAAIKIREEMSESELRRKRDQLRQQLMNEHGSDLKSVRQREYMWAWIRLISGALLILVFGYIYYLMIRKPGSLPAQLAASDKVDSHKQERHDDGDGGSDKPM